MRRASSSNPLPTSSLPFQQSNYSKCQLHERLKDLSKHPSLNGSFNIHKRMNCEPFVKWSCVFIAGSWQAPSQRFHENLLFHGSSCWLPWQPHRKSQCCSWRHTVPHLLFQPTQKRPFIYEGYWEIFQEMSQCCCFCPYHWSQWLPKLVTNILQNICIFGSHTGLDWHKG